MILRVSATYSIFKGAAPLQWRRRRGIMPLNPVVLTSIIRTSDSTNPEVGRPVFSVRHSSCLRPLAESPRQNYPGWDGATKFSRHAPRRTTEMNRLASHSHKSRDAIHLYARYDDRFSHKEPTAQTLHRTAHLHRVYGHRLGP